MKRSRGKLDLYVVYRLLKILATEGPLSRTALATNAKLNYQRAMRYISQLAEAGLVTWQGDKIGLTREGLETLKKIEEVLEALFGLKSDT